jgi:putative heme transporter
MRDHLAGNPPEGKVARVCGAARGMGASVVRGGTLMGYALHGARGARPDPAAATCKPRPVRWRRLGRGWPWAVAGGVGVVVALRVPAVWTDARGLFAQGVRLPWLGAAAAAEVAWLAGLLAAQRQLLAAAGARLPARAVAAVVFASTGLAGLLPAGPAAAAAWQAAQYRRRGVGRTAGAWAVLAGGIASTAVILAMLAAGAATAGIGRWWLFPVAAAVAAGIAAMLTAARRVGMTAQRPARHPGRWRLRLAAGLAGLAGHRVGLRRGAGVLAASGLSVLGEAGLLAASFGVAGTPVPWRGLMLACAASQLGGRLVPLPGGLGGVEGGALGALALSGTHPATAASAVIVYRVARYWAPGAAGAAAAAALSRRHRAPPAEPVPGPAAEQQQQPAEGQRASVDHPLQAGPGKAERALDVRQRDVDDGRVQHHHQLRGGQDQQRLARARAVGGHAARGGRPRGLRSYVGHEGFF